MTDNQEIINEIQKIENFYIMIFEPNPAKDIVKVWIDGSEIRSTYKRDVFYQILNTLVSSSVEKQARVACSQYGGFFIVDRVHETLDPMPMATDTSRLSFMQLRKDIETAMRSGKSAYDIDFEKLAKGHMKMSLNGAANVGFGKTANTFSGFVNYSNMNSFGKLYNPFG